MNFHEIGKTGLKVSNLSFGASSLARLVYLCHSELLYVGLCKWVFGGSLRV